MKFALGGKSFGRSLDFYTALLHIRTLSHFLTGSYS